MFSAWERYPDTPYDLPDGKQIRVDEWRKEVKTGLAIIRSGYMRIDNCPRFQIVVIFNNERVMTDRPIFRNFNDALEAADEWLANRKNEPIKVSRRRLTALPSPDNVAGAEPPMPKPVRIQRVPVFRPRVMPRKRVEKVVVAPTKTTGDAFGEALAEVYAGLYLPKETLDGFAKKLSIRIGEPVTKAKLQARMVVDRVAFRDDRRIALKKDEAMVEEAMLAIIMENPSRGLDSCIRILEQGEHAGYRYKWAKERYYAARKTHGGSAKSNRWRNR